MELKHSSTDERESKKRLVECISRFQKATEEEIKRLRDQNGLDVNNAVATLVEKIRSDHNSVFVAKPEDVKHVMALTGFQEVDAVRALIVNEELIKLRNNGFEITEAIEELSSRATDETYTGVLAEQRCLTHNTSPPAQREDTNPTEDTLTEDPEAQEELVNELSAEDFSNEEDDDPEDEEIQDDSSAPQVKRRKRESNTATSYESPSVLTMLPQLESFLDKSPPSTTETMSNLNISDSVSESAGIKKRILQGTELDNPKKKHKSRAVGL